VISLRLEFNIEATPQLTARVEHFGSETLNRGWLDVLETRLQNQIDKGDDVLVCELDNYMLEDEMIYILQDILKIPKYDILLENCDCRVEWSNEVLKIIGHVDFDTKVLLSLVNHENVDGLLKEYMLWWLQNEEMFLQLTDFSGRYYEYIYKVIVDVNSDNVKVKAEILEDEE
jgi:hypothetical protein